MPSVTLTIRTEESIRKCLDETAEALGRNRNWCINEALDHYLELHRWQVEHVKKGMAADVTFSTEEVRERLKLLGERR